MKTKQFFLSIALLMCIPFVANAQMYIDSLGIVQVGNYVHDIYGTLGPDYKDTTIVLSIKGNGNNWSNGKISFGDAYYNLNMNVSVGELGNNGGIYGDDTDILWLHGKSGIFYTSSNRAQDTIFYYVPDLFNNFHFNCNVLASNIALASDSRFKTDITPLESSLQTITSLTPVSYKLLPRFSTETIDIPTAGLSDKDLRDIEYFNNLHKNQQPDGPHFGFIAQEVKDIYPELVHTDKDGYMYIDYIGMIPLLVNAIGELNEQIEELKAENSELNQAVINAQLPAVDDNNQPSQIADNFLRNALYQNRPNPFSSSTSITMSLRSDVTQAVVYIFDMQGSLLKTIPVNDRGNVSVTIDGGDLNAGMFIYTLIADGKEIASKRMILTK
ncbi:MAG: tail fiber domain-containing protein [Muribaculaceae bacterium]|nr:tail fiber domain-containing protein [Muribaculaceae bacterium]